MFCILGWCWSSFDDSSRPLLGSGLTDPEKTKSVRKSTVICHPPWIVPEDDWGSRIGRMGAVTPSTGLCHEDWDDDGMGGITLGDTVKELSVDSESLSISLFPSFSFSLSLSLSLSLSYLSFSTLFSLVFSPLYLKIYMSTFFFSSNNVIILAKFIIWFVFSKQK